MKKLVVGLYLSSLTDGNAPCRSEAPVQRPSSNRRSPMPAEWESLPQNTKSGGAVEPSNGIFPASPVQPARYQLAQLKIWCKPETDVQTLYSACIAAINKQEEEEERKRLEAERELKEKIDTLVAACGKTRPRTMPAAPCSDILQLDPSNAFVEQTKLAIEEKKRKAEEGLRKEGSAAKENHTEAFKRPRPFMVTRGTTPYARSV
jgi:hypothetical protein